MARQVRRRPFLGAFGAAAVWPGLTDGLAEGAGCNAGDAGDPPSPAAARGVGRGGETLTLVLDWLLNANHAAIFAGQAQGFFAHAGLAVEIVAPSDADLPVRLLAAGRADLAVGYGSQINLLNAAGLDLVRIATLIDSPLNAVAAQTGIRSLADLRARTVGFNVAGVEDAMLGAMLRSAGVPPGSVTRVKLSYDLVSGLLTHRLDAAIGAYRNEEVIALRDAGANPTVFLPEEHGVPVYDELIVLARRGMLGDARLKRFVDALRAATASVQHAPDAVWAALVAAHPEQDTHVGALSWKATLPYLAADPARLDGARYLRFQEFALAEGLISRAVPLADFATTLG